METSTQTASSFDQTQTLTQALITNHSQGALILSFISCPFDGSSQSATLLLEEAALSVQPVDTRQGGPDHGATHPKVVQHSAEYAGQRSQTDSCLFIYSCLARRHKLTLLVHVASMHWQGLTRPCVLNAESVPVVPCRWSHGTRCEIRTILLLLVAAQRFKRWSGIHYSSNRNDTALGG